MNNDLDRFFPPGEPLDDAVIRQISAQIAAPSDPVRPLPSNTILGLISLAVFAIVAVGVASAVHFKALAALSVGEMAVYYGTVAIFATLFARALVERMIPGQKRLIRPAVLSLSAVAVLGVLGAILYSDYTTTRFVATGIPCLRLGLIGALIGGLLGWRLLQRGYLVSPRETIAIYGFFAGLVGLAALALHCPIRNSLHFLVWHLGAMLLAGLAGVLLGRFIENHAD